MTRDRDVIVAERRAARNTRARRRTPPADPAGSTPIESPLLDAKFAVPSHTVALVARPRLLDRLDSGVQRPLTLVSAPAGTGKTVLVSSWGAVHRAGGAAVAWISLEPGDERPGIFWSHVVEALARQGLDVADVGKPSGPGAVPRRLLSRLAAKIAVHGAPLVLVLDDADLLTARALAGDVEFLLRHTESLLRLVVLTRVDPVLSLHQCRAAGAITEIRKEDLAFTEAEASTLFDQAGIRLSATRVAELTRRTDGWAAALRFAEISAKRRVGADEPVLRIAGDEGNIFEYLIAEVLDRQPADVRDALLRTSLVEVLRPGLFEVLTDRHDGAQVLHTLAHGNAFVQPVEGLAGAYRYNALFREFLRAQLAYEQPGAVPELHRTAARWLADQGFLVEAVREAVAANAWHEAAGFVVDNLAIGTLLAGRDNGRLADLFGHLPTDLTDPSACVVRAAGALAEHDPRAAATNLDLAEKRAPGAGRAREDAIRLAVSVVAAVRARMDRDLVGGLAAVKTAERSLSRAAPEQVAATPELWALVLTSKSELLLWAGDVQAARDACAGAISAAQAPGCGQLLTSCLGQLALIEATQGCLRRAAELADRAGAAAERSGSDLMDSLQAADVALAWVRSEQDDTKGARQHLRRAAATIDTAGPTAVLAYGLVRARLLRLRGDPDGANRRIQAVRASFAPTRRPRWVDARLASEEAACHLARGRPELAAGVAQTLRDPSCLEARVVLMQTRLARGDTSTDRAFVPALRRPTSPLDTRVSGWLVESDRLLAAGQQRLARSALAQASRLAELERLRRPFLDGPARVRALLREDQEMAGRLRWLGPASASGTCRGTAVGGTTASRDTYVAPLVTPLTEREQEVLAHLAALLTTEEMATAMCVSVNTIRTHVRSILRKLSASRRNEAVRRARELNLLAV